MKIHKTLLFLTLIFSAILFTTIPQGNAISWYTEKQLTTDPSSDYSPAITQTRDGRIWVLWHADRTGDMEIYYNTYNRIAWSGDKRLTTNSGNDINPAATQSGDGGFWLFWSSDRMGPIGNYKIFYRTSNDQGETWSSDSQLTNTTYSDRRPSVMQAADGKIWVVWHSNRTGNSELFYKTYDGESWSNDTQLTSNSYSDIEPSVIQARDGKIWVFWSSFRTGDYEIFYKTASDNGESWSDDTQLTHAQTSWDELPSAMQARDGKIWVFWATDRSGKDYDIYYKTYDGLSWSDDTVFVNYRAEETLPSIFQSANKTIWVTWSSNKGGGDSEFDIWHKVTVPNAHDVGIASVTPSQTIVYGGYETQVQINVDVWNYGLNNESFTVSAYYNSTKIGTQNIALASNAKTTLTFTWNTSGLLYGYYTLKAEASVVSDETDTTDNSLTGARVTVTIPGDANGDRKVDTSDLFDLSKAYGSGPLKPNWNLNCDFNGDNKVDASDLFGISKNYSKSW